MNVAVFGIVSLVFAQAGDRAGDTLRTSTAPSIERGTGQCVASRSFSSATSPATAILAVQVGEIPESPARLTVIIPNTDGKRTASGRLRVRYGASREVVTQAMSSSDATAQRRFVQLTPDEALEKAVLTSSSLSIEPVSGGVVTQRLALAVDDPSVMAAAVAACRDEQRTAIGIDPVLDAAVVTRARVLGNPGPMFAADAYPKEARAKRVEGTIGMVLRIDAKGQTTDCRVYRGSGLPSMDSETCAIAKRVRYTPAKGASGAPVPSEVPIKIIWRLESSEP